MNNPIKYLYLIPAGIVICTILSVISSCSADDNPPGGTLPAGKYPMTFTSAVGELVVTRGTVNNSWAGTEKVAIQLGNDAASYGEIKEYKAANDGKLTPAGNAAPLYWRNTTETVTAWYPYSTARPTSFTVQENQNTGDNYQASDFLYTTGTYTYKSSGACALVFKHLPAKVVINLTNGDQVTAEEAAAAEVSIVNQSLASGTINNDGTVEAAVVATGVITPYKLASPTTDYQQTVQALLVPQDIAGKKLIKVTIGTGDTRDYYFTPATGTAALAAGTQYTYNITVMQEGLRVESLSATWKDNEQNMADPQEAEFKIYLSTLTAPDKSAAKVTDGTGTELSPTNGIYTTKSKTVNIVYTVDEGYELWNFAPEVKAGICTQPQQVTNSGNDYTYTLTDICTDIWLGDITTPITQQKAAAVGDYYYSDGTWSSTLASDKTCIGIVFKAGAEKGDALTTYDGKIKTKIHGYVVALTDALTTPGDWGTRYESTSQSGLTLLPMIDDTGNNRDKPDQNSAGYSVYGYTNTKIIVDKFQNNATEWANYNAFSNVVSYRSSVPAPSNSSDWYLPSIVQLTNVYNAIYDSSKNLTAMGTNLSTAGTSFITDTNAGRYWSSSEGSAPDAWYFIFSEGKPYNYAKNGKNKGNASYARAILTF